MLRDKHFELLLGVAAVALSAGWGKGPCEEQTPPGPSSLCSEYNSGCSSILISYSVYYVCAGGYVNCPESGDGPIMEEYDVISTQVNPESGNCGTCHEIECAIDEDSKRETYPLKGLGDFCFPAV